MYCQCAEGDENASEEDVTEAEVSDAVAAVLAEGGGLQHRMTSPPGITRPHTDRHSHRLHVRSRMQKPLAPLPSAVMVGAGLEAAAQLGKSLVKRLVRTFSHTSAAGGFTSPTEAASMPPQAPPKPGSQLSVDVSVACVGAGNTTKHNKYSATHRGGATASKPPLSPIQSHV